MKITILDPEMCCNSGVCGTEVDDKLVTSGYYPSKSEGTPVLKGI